jgi:hypothetical protein
VGEQISLGGRIVAVADSYDAMTATRSYSKATTPALARQELTACAGSQFDPVVVRAFLEASVGRLSVVGGPLAWLGEFSTLNGVPQLGQAVGAAGNALAGFATVIGVGAAVAVGAHHVPVHNSHLAPTTVPEPLPHFAAAPVVPVRRELTPPAAAPRGDAKGSGKTSDPPPASAPQPVKTPSSLAPSSSKSGDADHRPQHAEHRHGRADHGDADHRPQYARHRHDCADHSHADHSHADDSYADHSAADHSAADHSAADYGYGDHGHAGDRPRRAKHRVSHAGQWHCHGHLDGSVV